MAMFLVNIVTLNTVNRIWLHEQGLKPVTHDTILRYNQRVYHKPFYEKS